MTKLIANSEASDTLTSSAMPALAPGEVILGQFVGIDAAGNPLVSYPQLTESTPFVAMSTVPIAHQYIGRQVALLFARGDYHQPIIIGFIHSPLHDLLESFSLSQSSEGTSDDEVFEPSEKDHALDVVDDETKTIRVDGKKVILEGQEEVVLTCGEASITLTKAGKILIRGKYLLSRSSGVNRILGGSVQVN
jgi:hypothetical protein